MNKWIGSVAFLLVVGVSASEAQFSAPPLINPGMRPGTGPNFGPFQSGGVGNPYVTPFGPSSYTGGFYGPFAGNAGGYYGPVLGTVGGFQQGGNVGVGSSLPAAGVITPYATTGIVFQQSSNVTGHPTRFNTYSPYFNNQGTGLLTNVMTSGQGQWNMPVGANGRINPGVGSRPQQGQQGRPNPIQP